MKNHIDTLFNLCKQQPFDTERIKSYIKDNKLNSEEITRTAIKLCDYGSCGYVEFIYHNNREPLPHELDTYNWETLFDIFIENGLDANLVICDDKINYDNILQSLIFIDDDDLNARVLRKILSKGGSPNMLINGVSFFQEVDCDFIIDIEMDLYWYKHQLDVAFRFWLVLVGFGGLIKDNRLPINMRENNTPEIFKDFENFDYNIIRKENDFELQIIDKKSKKIVATV